MDVRPTELTGRRLELSDLTADISVRLPEGDPDTEQDVVLAGDMRSYRWTINGRSYDDTVHLVADNPGRWMLHCHNAFHLGAGMMTRLDHTT